MECFIAFILILVTVAVLGGSVRRNNGSRSAYELLGREHRGTVSGIGWFGLPNVVFAHRAARVVVRISKNNPASHRRSPATQVIVQWPNNQFQCEIWPANSAMFRYSTPGLEQISTGVASFDTSFVIYGRDRDEIIRVINPVVQQQIQRLHALPAPWPVHIRFAFGSLVITKDHVIRRATDLHDFVADALELFDQALLTQSRGIEFMDTMEAQPLETVTCRVCGDEITEELVFCRRCKTPHHRDCWLYNGGCSVFACGESNFDVPRVAPRSISPEAATGEEG